MSNRPTIQLRKAALPPGSAPGVMAAREVLIGGEVLARFTRDESSRGSIALVDAFDRHVLMDQAKFEPGSPPQMVTRPRPVVLYQLSDARMLEEAVYAWEAGAIPSLAEQRQRHEALLVEEAAQAAREALRHRASAVGLDLLVALEALLREADSVTIANGGTPGVSDRWEAATVARTLVAKVREPRA